MKKQLQPHHDRSRTIATVAGTFLVAGFIAIGLGVSFDGGPHSGGRYAQIVGIVVAALAFFLALGFWVQHAHARRALGEMEEGAVLGDWHSEGGEHVQVGPKLALVNGTVRSYGLFLQAVTGVSIDASGALTVHATVDSGYGPTAFKVRVPGSPERDATERCAQALAQFHGVPQT